MKPVVVPGGVPVTFTDSKGREHVVYGTPFPSAGPVEVTSGSGRRAWIYMFAYFVFTWVEGATQVDIAHGTIEGDRMGLWNDIPIRGDWSATTLACFGQQWARDHLAKFTGQVGKRCR